MDTQNTVNNQDHITIQIVKTAPFAGQKPGTSGLRKKVTVIQEKNYLENFISSVFQALPQDQLKKENVLVVGGDGRYFNKQAIDLIIRIACAEGVDHIHVAQNGLMSTPAISAYIRYLTYEQKLNCIGGFILTASHNPGGPKNDFGIKFNISSGSPAMEDLTEKIYKYTTQINEYKISSQNLHVDLSQKKEYVFQNVDRERKQFNVKIVDSTEHYISLMQKLFNFENLKKLFQRQDFKFKFDGMHGIAGPYAKRIFVDLLGADVKSLLNCEPKEDFGGGHPDPNLTYAQELVKILDVFHKSNSIPSNIPNFGAACDGDADRNMILGRQIFVTPSDSVAVLTAYYSSVFGSEGKILGVARSMPTSGALDKVAEKMGIKNIYEVPTGWKFFGNLMDAGKINICGEESFGTGSNHIREKDGIWAILAWLSILADKNVDKTQNGKFFGVEDIMKEFWQNFGRNYYQRYDYEAVDTESANQVMKHLEGQFEYFKGLQEGNKADIFNYTDPVDGSVSKNQGIRFIYADGSRITFRLSGTGSEGATIRVYFEQYSKDQLFMKTEKALKDIIKVGLELSKIDQFTGRKEPSVIT
ncbi:phosphoglucomutase 2, putative [Ichthyophthirius multifiliis]|uniref:phosphoglucomutase (alpha-D-glucose-1,6-bisphosphate-dependent) n=1 Tax=Ichthyophthirius multifiliis TaxID=5932 RepID=G0R131_ICHMU|nr:phosphoglucomutase 2, putative [Ichthyophthirius multifiliis]EGR28798.1 phosphoglucomutase 2, putative [Ichthyophthirius multifiliis]|eukprot:XP_004030034.1 phosphoglucomutase 2, putative [Ichthyophthirius multifiliis]